MLLIALLFAGCDGNVDDSKPVQQPPSEVETLPSWLVGNFTGSMNYFEGFTFDIYLNGESDALTMFVFIDDMPGPAMEMRADDPLVTLILDGSGARLTATQMDPDFPDEVYAEMVFTRSGDNVLVDIPIMGTVMSATLTPTSDPVPNPVRSVVIDQKDPEGYIYVAPDETVQLTYTTYPEDADPIEFEWSIYDSHKYGVIDPVTGVYAAKASEGQTRVSVMTPLAEMGVYDEAYITITNPIERVEIIEYEGKTTGYPEDVIQLNVSAYGGYYNYATWENSNPDVAEIVNPGINGTLTVDIVCLAPGETEITANVRGVDSEPFKITVTGIDSVTLDKTEQKVNVGEEFTLAATVEPDLGFDMADIVWTSDNPEVATVDENGLVTAVREGVANITASALGTESEPCVVTVSDPYVELGTDGFKPPQWATGLFDSAQPMQIDLGDMGPVMEPLEVALKVRLGSAGIELLTDAENAWFDAFKTNGRESLTGIKSQKQNVWNWVVTYTYNYNNDSLHETEETIRCERTATGLEMTIENTLGDKVSYTLTRIKDQDLRVLSEEDMIVIESGFSVLGFLTNGVQEDPYWLPDISGITQTANGYELKDVPMYYDSENRVIVNGTTYRDAQWRLYLDVDVDGHKVKVDAMDMQNVLEDIRKSMTVNYDGQDIFGIFFTL